MICGTGTDLFAGDAFVGHAAKPEPRRYAKVEIRPGAFHMVELPSKSLGSPGPPRGGGRADVIASGGPSLQRGKGRPVSAPSARGRLPVAAAAASGTLPYQVDTTELAPVRS